MANKYFPFLVLTIVGMHLLFLSGCFLDVPTPHPEEGENVTEGEIDNPEIPPEEGIPSEGESVPSNDEGEIGAEEGEIQNEEGEMGNVDEGEGEGPTQTEGEPTLVSEGEQTTTNEGENDVREGESVGTEGETNVSEGEGESTPATPRYISADVSYSRSENTPDVLDGAPTDAEGGDNEEAERELVEPDIIHRVGNYVYILNQYRGLMIIDLATHALLAQAPTYGHPRDLYLAEGRAYVLVSYAREIYYSEQGFQVAYGSRLYVLNVEDPTEILLEGSFSFEGDLVDSRRVGDVLYVVCSNYTWYKSEPATGQIDPETKSYGNTWASSINIADPEAIYLVDQVNFSGYGNLIQATPQAIFCVSNDYSRNAALITYVDIADPNGDIKVRGSAEAPGQMADRFKMNAWNGVLRTVTNTWFPQRETYITTFDLTSPDHLTILGQTSVENASGETLFATRFDGPRAYIVTYLVVDPLFVIDLSDPANPKVAGELKVPGWSTYIEPKGDRLIALGVDDQGGRRVMVSLFDVSQPESPALLKSASFGEGWSWSSAYSDVKAFTVYDNLIAVPFSGWNYGSGGYDRLQFIEYDQDTLYVRGYVDLQGSALRSFGHGPYFYALTQEQLAVIDVSNMDSPEVIDRIILAENVVDVIPLSNGWVVDVICRYDSNDMLLRARSTEASGADLILPASSFVDSVAFGNTVALVFSAYEYQSVYRSFYQVFLLDFSNPQTPTQTAKWEVNLEPWYGSRWWGPYYDVGIAPAGVPSNKYLRYPSLGSQDNPVMRAGDSLVLRGYGQKFDLVFGDIEPWQGLAIIDLTTSDSIVYVGLGYNTLVSINAANDSIYITTKTPEGTDAQNRVICAYYLSLFDPTTLHMNQAVNVPGIFLHRVSETGCLLFQDYQYIEGTTSVTCLQSGFMIGNSFLLADTFYTPFYMLDSIQADNEYIVYLNNRYYYPWLYDGGVVPEGGGKDNRIEAGTTLFGLYVSREGLFLSLDNLPMGNGWIRLLGVSKGQAFISVEGAAVAQCDFSVSPPQVATLQPTMGWTDKIRFSTTHAYVPMGYSGVLEMIF